MHQYFGTLHPKSKTYKWIYNKNAKLKWIPKLFTEHKIYLFQSNIQLRGKNGHCRSRGYLYIILWWPNIYSNFHWKWSIKIKVKVCQTSGNRSMLSPFHVTINALFINLVTPPVNWKERQNTFTITAMVLSTVWYLYHSLVWPFSEEKQKKSLFHQMRPVFVALLLNLLMRILLDIRLLFCFRPNKVSYY